MRRTIAALTLALLAAGLPLADAAAPPTVKQVTIVAGIGTVTADVTVPKGVSLLGFPTPGGTIQAGVLLGSGDWSAFALLGRGGKPVRAFQVLTNLPDHCPSRKPSPGTSVGSCREDVAHAVVSGATPTPAGISVRYALPAGTYQIVVSGPPNEIVIAGLFFDGAARGSRVLYPKKTAKAAFQRVRGEDPLRAEVAGSFKQTVARNAVAVVGSWSNTADTENGAYYSAECVVPGTGLPVDAETCAARQAVEPAATRPAFANVEGGPPSAAKLGYTTHVTPVLKPGAYVNAYRVGRAGTAPGVGAFVWWLQADALK